MTKLRIMMLITLLGSFPLFLVGCLGSGGTNPMGTTSMTPSTENTIIATSELENPKVLAARFHAPVAKKYSYSAPSFKVIRHLMPGLARPSGCMRLWLKSAVTADHIFITVSGVKVKNDKGKSIKIKDDPKEVDLLSSASISDLLADLDLDSGVYRELSLKIVSGKVVKDGETKDLYIPSHKVKFLGKFEIKDGYRTELTLKFIHKLREFWTPWWGKKYIFLPVVKISSELVEIFDPPPAVAEGDVNGVVTDFVSKAGLSGVTATFDGTAFTAVSDADGKFSFAKVPEGDYSLKLNHPDYLDRAFQVSVLAGQISDVTAELNPAQIKSSVGNTGWFSLEFPFADANGEYGEVSMETPVVVDFVSLNFLKVEVAFDAEYFVQGEGRFNTYLSSAKQLQVLQDLGTWWVGNSGTFGSFLGQYRSTNPSSRHVVDVTEFVRNNPNSMYFLASRNLSIANMRLNNIQMTIFYR